MDRNDGELRSSLAILCKIAVTVMVNISRPPITCCLHLPFCSNPTSLHLSQLPAPSSLGKIASLEVENSSQGWTQPACFLSASLTNFWFASKLPTDHLYDSILQQYK